MEIIHRQRPEAPLKAAILDFDGTISLIREGWQGIMIPLFIEVLAETPGGKFETESKLESTVREFVELLPGKQTVYQCMRLAEKLPDACRPRAFPADRPRCSGSFPLGGDQSDLFLRSAADCFGRHDPVDAAAG